MKSKILFFILFGLISFSIGCERLGNNIQEKANEKVDKKIDENLRMADSVLGNIGKQLDSMTDKSFKEMDSVKYKLDSVSNEIKDLLEKQKKLIDKK